MPVSQAKNRNNYIDWLKGYLILLVVLGHTSFVDSGVFWAIYRFHMPMFFCISGYLFSNKLNFKDFFIKKFKTLMIPYFFYFCISFVLTNLFVNHVGIRKGIKIFLLNGKLLASVNNWAIWYLPLFFITLIFFYFISKIKNKKVFIILLIFLGLSTVPSYNFLSSLVNDDIIPFSIQVLPASLFYMGTGWLIKEYKEVINKLSQNTMSIISIIMLILGIILSIKNYDQIIRISTYNYLIAALFIMQFVVFITKDNNNKFFAYLGRNSLAILGLHRILICMVDISPIHGYLDTININGHISAIIISFSVTLVICLLNQIFGYIKNFILSKIKKGS